MSDLEDEACFRFAPGGGDATDLSSDARIALLAVCVAQQQKAGFRDYIDIRQAACPDCKAPGFNTGWGVWAFTCGAEIHSDGETAEPCGRRSKEGEDGR